MAVLRSKTIILSSIPNWPGLNGKVGGWLLFFFYLSTSRRSLTIPFAAYEQYRVCCRGGGGEKKNKVF